MPDPDVQPPTGLIVDLDDLSSRAGQFLGHSDWHTVTQDDIDTFARLTGDDQWIHVDPDRARSGPSGPRSPTGTSRCLCPPSLLDEVVTVTGAEHRAQLRHQPDPLPGPGSHRLAVRAAVELAEVDDLDGGAQAHYRLTYEVEGARKPGCVAEILYRYYTRFPRREKAKWQPMPSPHGSAAFGPALPSTVAAAGDPARAIAGRAGVHTLARRVTDALARHLGGRPGRRARRCSPSPWTAASPTRPGREPMVLRDEPGIPGVVAAHAEPGRRRAVEGPRPRPSSPSSTLVDALAPTNFLPTNPPPCAGRRDPGRERPGRPAQLPRRRDQQRRLAPPGRPSGVRRSVATWPPHPARSCSATTSWS